MALDGYSPCFQLQALIPTGTTLVRVKEAEVLIEDSVDDWQYIQDSPEGYTLIIAIHRLDLGNQTKEAFGSIQLSRQDLFPNENMSFENLNIDLMTYEACYCVALLEGLILSRQLASQIEAALSKRVAAMRNYKGGQNETTQ
jgi:hypothetical protein